MNIKRFINDCKLRKARIGVVGDLMIDEYFHVDAHRVSPEFPIPILQSPTALPDIAIPGGAGNLCNQFKHFNTDLKVLGFMDGYGREVYRKSGVDIQHCTALILDNHIPIKRRFYQGLFPLCRWDVEACNYGLGTLLSDRQNVLFNTYLESFVDNEVIIFSDYNKGVFVGVRFPWFEKTDAITIIDPKNKPIDRWRGCTIFKPNKKEAQELSGIPGNFWQDQCNYFQKALGCIAVVITCGGDGVYGKVGNKCFEYKPSIPESGTAFYIGAGDCFAAVLGLTMAHSLDVIDGVQIACEAAAAYIDRKYNEPVSQIGRAHV
jgi:D-beta-D-heptose 7-phosphate kinase / D-beta-D-heptose 1-phosphate adenosyltransferase